MYFYLYGFFSRKHYKSHIKSVRKYNKALEDRESNTPTDARIQEPEEERYVFIFFLSVLWPILLAAIKRI